MKNLNDPLKNFFLIILGGVLFGSVILYADYACHRYKPERMYTKCENDPNCVIKTVGYDRHGKLVYVETVNL